MTLRTPTVALAMIPPAIEARLHEARAMEKVTDE
jgi:hypothetical protein